MATVTLLLAICIRRIKCSEYVICIRKENVIQIKNGIEQSVPFLFDRTDFVFMRISFVLDLLVLRSRSSLNADRLCVAGVK